jgi:hypothetical protein
VGLHRPHALHPVDALAASHSVSSLFRSACFSLVSPRHTYGLLLSDVRGFVVRHIRLVAAGETCLASVCGGTTRRNRFALLRSLTYPASVKNDQCGEVSCQAWPQAGQTCSATGASVTSCPSLLGQVPDTSSPHFGQTTHASCTLTSPACTERCRPRRSGAAACYLVP